MKILNDDIHIVEVELLGLCNLKCPLCVSTLTQYNDIIKYHEYQLDSLIHKLDLFKNMKSLVLAGLATEPTLYKRLFELLDYCHTRQISVRLYTNGNTHSSDWWKLLAQHLTINDECIFTICGSTQELHEKYRVGSNLQQILDNASAFRNENRNDRAVAIRFEYNKHDINNIEKILKQFSKYSIINSQTYNEQLSILPDTTGICIEKKLGKLYTFFRNQIQLNRLNIECQSLNDGSIVIDNFGKMYPCNYARLNGFCFEHGFNYEHIFNDNNGFCCECDRNFKKIMKKLNIEGFNGNG